MMTTPFYIESYLRRVFPSTISHPRGKEYNHSPFTLGKLRPKELSRVTTCKWLSHALNLAMCIAQHQLAVILPSSERACSRLSPGGPLSLPSS